MATLFLVQLNYCGSFKNKCINLHFTTEGKGRLLVKMEAGNLLIHSHINFINKVQQKIIQDWQFKNESLRGQSTILKVFIFTVTLMLLHVLN